jgi:hypothetical protein
VWALLAWAIATVFWVFDWWWWLFSVRKMLIGAIALWTSMRLVRYVPHQRFLTGISLAACGLSVLTFFTAAAYGFFASAHADSLRGGATDLGWGDANFIAAILVLMLPTGLFLAMTAKGIPRYIAILSILLTAAVIALTASRGGALLVLGIVLYVVFRSHIKLQYAIPIGIVAILLMIFGPGGSDLLARFSDPKDFLSIVIRLMFFREAWHRVQDYWPLGMGWGQGIVYSDRLFGEDPHNYLLVLGAELGLVGLVLWFTLQFVLWRRIVRVIHDPRTEMIGRTLQLMWAISLLNLMFEPTFQGLQYHFLFYWILGGYIGMAKLMTEEPSPARAPAPAT